MSETEFTPPKLLPPHYAVIGAVRQFAQTKTNIVSLTKSSALVTKGVFRFSRNPMYVGMILTLGGLAVLMGSGFAWLIVMTFSLIIR